MGYNQDRKIVLDKISIFVSKQSMYELDLVHYVWVTYGFGRKFVKDALNILEWKGYIKLYGSNENRFIEPILPKIDESKNIKKNKEEISVEDDLNGINNAQQM